MIVIELEAHSLIVIFSLSKINFSIKSRVVLLVIKKLFYFLIKIL